MSMNTWTVTGYGVDAEELCPTISSQIAFIKKYLPEEYKEMQEDSKDSDYDMSNTSDYVDFCNGWISEREDKNGNIGFPALFALAIQQNEEDFNPEYFCCDGYSAVIYEDRLPWEMSDRVKNMKAEDMEAIFKKYLDELGISATIGRQSVEFSG